VYTVGKSLRWNSNFSGGIFFYNNNVF